MIPSIEFILAGTLQSYDSVEQSSEGGAVSCPKNCGAVYSCLISRTRPPEQQVLLKKRELARIKIEGHCPDHARFDRFSL
jgi:hypothetical protein